MLLKSNTWDDIQNAMWEVVNHQDGTGKLARVMDADVYGKTGTAQNPHGEDHSWFAGYMSFNQSPLISLSVLVEHGGRGSVEAASIAGEILKYVHEKKILQ